ncbi:MAG: stage II sporulation protein P [Peptococcaceae bacterium]|nr:stage II sporulation protein P [Peptococcaceae bacterium]
MYYRIRYMLYRHRYRLAGVYRAAALGGAAVLLFFFLCYIPWAGVLSKIPGLKNFSLFDIAVSWSERDPRGLVRSAAPVMAWAGNQEDYPEEITPMSVVTAMLAPFRVNLDSPPDLLASEMPALAEYRRGLAAKAASGAGGGADRKTPETGAVLTSAALLGIYHTHTGETYALTDGVERLQGKQGGVVEVGRALKDTLEKEYGIRVVHDDRVNDENYSYSYIESEKTARRLLENNPDVQILIDIHRDAGKPRSESLVKVDGKEAAPILFVAGSDARAPFPAWRANYDYAVKLADRINKKFPGLCTGVRVKEGRYNQFLHPRALLVEVGSVSNSTAEAVESARMLARVLAAEIMELAPDKLFKKHDYDHNGNERSSGE